MALYANTAPASQDEPADSFRKVNQILDTGAVGAASTLYSSVQPSSTDEIGDSAKRLNQHVHNNNGF